MNGQTLTRAFIPLPGGTQAVYDPNLSKYRVPDWLGSFRIASTSGRAWSWSGAFAPFGERYAESGSAAAKTFAGHNWDTVSDLYDAQFREDHGGQGRWISPDPAGLDAVDLTDPQTWNLYAYVRNSPLTLVDPFGLWGCPTCPPDPEPVATFYTQAQPGENSDLPMISPSTYFGSGAAGLRLRLLLLKLDTPANNIATISAGPPGAKEAYCKDQSNQAALNTLLPGLGDSIYNYDNVDVPQKLTSGLLDSFFGFGTVAGQAMSWISKSDMALTNIRSATGLPKTLVSKGLKVAGRATTAINAIQAAAKATESYKACMASD